jgi:hypothetical protein
MTGVAVTRLEASAAELRHTLSIVASTISWLVLCGSVLWLAVVVASQMKAAQMLRRHQAGSEFISMALWPFYLLAPFAGIAGPIAGFWLAARTSSTAGSVVLYLVSGVLTAWTALWIISSPIRAARSRAESRAVSRVVSQDEMIELIRSHAIRSFTRESGSVSIQYENYWSTKGKYMWRAQHADPGGYDRYVAAALELAPEVVVAFHDNDSPRERLFRWITADEAESLLEHGMIKTFNYGAGSLADEPASGEQTGIKLIDHGWVRHIYVEPAMEHIMVSVARAAQRSHDGFPQFCIDGKYEPVADPDQG